MILETFQYFENNRSWTVSSFPALDSEQTLVLIFAAPQIVNNPEPIKELFDFYKQSKIIGCSTSGEISGQYLFDHSLSVAVIQFEKTPLKIACTKVKSNKGSYHAGQDIVSELDSDDLKGIFVLSDGLNINGSELVKGLNTVNKEGVVITGGLAGDGNDFKNTWTIFNNDLISDHVVAVGFYGDCIQLGHGSRGGWDIFGPERRITHSIDNILYELDNKPALTLYKEYLGDKAEELPASGLLYPLAIRKNEAGAKIVRTILAVDEKANSLIFAGDMPMGYLAQLMRTSFDRLITGATQASELALAKHIATKEQDEPILLVSISCVGRRLVLGERTEEETESVLQLFPQSTQQIGFYSYGEISPYATGSCDLHNQTMTLTSFREVC